MKGIFVTGTDTGVGKTIITGLLARYLLEKGQQVITQKWIQTGCTNFSLDIKMHLKMMQKELGDISDFLDLVCPYVFRLPASPHLASRKENKVISSSRIIKSFKFLAGHFDLVIVEGTGGALVPFNKKHLVIDIVKRLDLPVLLVVGNKLGAINQTLLTVEALRLRKIKILGIIFNNLKNQLPLVLEDNPSIIKELTQEDCLGTLPWTKDTGFLYRKFSALAKRLPKWITG